MSLKVKEPRVTYTYRTKPSVKKKADAKAKKNKTSVSALVDNFLYDYISR